MITSVQLKNFKGHNRAFQLGAATMIVGDNFKGKSGLFQGITLGVHGYLKHPTGDKRLDPFGLASGNPMEIRLGYSYPPPVGAGIAIERTWTKDKRGSVRYEGYDGEPLMPSILMDARTYFDLSPDKRMRYVFGAVKLADGEFSSDKLIADLKNLKVDPMTETHQSALNDVIKTVSESWTGFTSEKEMGVDITVQDWLAKVIETLKERAKLAKQAVTRMVQTVAGITELQLRDTTEIEANTAALEQQLQTVREQIAAANTELGSIANRIQVAEQRGQLLASLRLELQNCPVPDEAVIAREADVNAASVALIDEGNALMKELGSIEADIANAEKEQTKQQQVAQVLEEIGNELEKHPDRAERIVELEKALEKARKNQMDLTPSITEKRKSHSEQAMARAIKSTSERNRHVLALADLEKKLAELADLKECPFCSCTGDAFHTAAGHHFRNEIADTRQRIATLDGDVSTMDTNLATLQRELEREEALLTEYQSSINRDEGLIAVARRAQNDRATLLTRKTGLLAQVAPPTDIEAKRAAWNACGAKIETNNTACVENSKAMVTIASMKRAKEIDAALGDAPEDIKALKRHQEELQRFQTQFGADYASIDANVKRGVAAKADALRQNQAVAERDKAKAEQDMTKLAVEAVTEFQQKMVDKAFGTIITDANRFTDGILESPLVYRDGEIGRDRAGTFVGHDYLSGTEQALCFAAISVALAMQSPFKLVMIDEMTRLSEANKLKVINRMLALIGDKMVHQFIGVDTAKRYYQVNLNGALPSDVQFIEL